MWASFVAIAQRFSAIRRRGFLPLTFLRSTKHQI